MKKDKTEINQWLIERSWEMKNETNFPNIGYIIPGVAVGFLIKTDCTFCILEPFITNPKANQEDRNKGLDIIIEKLLEKAKKLNYKGAFGFSTFVPMIERGVKHGFLVHEINSTTIFKEIQ